MKSRIFLLAVGLCIQLALPAQCPYRIGKADIGIGIGAVGLSGLGIWAQHRVAPFTPAQLSGLDPAQIPSFDRINVGDWRPQAAKVSDVAILAACASPFALLAGKSERHDVLKIALLGAEAGLISFGLVGTAKGLVHRARPFDYGSIAPLTEQTNRDARLSFFSGHTCFTATATFFAAQVFSDYHPDSKWKALVWAGAALAPAGIGYLRMRAGKHFLSDVVTGYLVGAASGILVPMLHRSSSKLPISIQPMFWGKGSGVILSWRW